MSRLSDQSKVLAQRQAILEQRVRELESGARLPVEASHQHREPTFARR
jgi:hypothetical protein